ncbi:MAG: hypothetical protein ACTH8F_08340 [Microbacterium sp.]|uniref:hypothetical protein n=1 Tax=Microbacterium sp. TaxID=51671 RepID=UPI003F9E6B5C
MVDMILSMLNLIGGGPPVGMSDLLLGPAEYNQTLYDAVILVHNAVVKPITSIVLAIMAVVMLSTQSSRMDADRELGIKIIAGTMLKIALVFIACMWAPKILDAIAGVSVTIANGINEVDFTGGAGTGEFKLGDEIGRDTVEDLSDTDGLLLVLLLFLPWVLMNVGGAIAFVLVFLRFLQMFLLSAFSSLPVAFFAHDDTKQMGIGYLKAYASVALSGTIMILAVALYQALVLGFTQNQMGSIPEDSDTLMTWASGNFLIFIVAPIVLIIIMFKAHGLAKNLVGDA